MVWGMCSGGQQVLARVTWS